MSLNSIPKRYLELAEKWLNGSATPEEKEEFNKWFGDDQGEDLFVPSDRGSNDEEYKNRLLLAIEQKIRGGQPEIKLTPYPWYRAIAAAVFAALLALGGWWLYVSGQGEEGSETKLAVSGDVLPGSDKAVLTLADGRMIELDSLSDGALSTGAGYVIHKAGGELIYETVTGKEAESTYNAIRIPRGGQFRLTLPDGSRVWLNSESSLRFPTFFKESDRLVELTGEGYFEVKQSLVNGKKRPFRISVNGTEMVEVLGTSFNIMAYSNEKAIKTTLLEGSVKVDQIGGGVSHILKPGEQSVYSSESGNFTIHSDVDVYEASSWKDGVVTYRDADIPAIMRYLERWYDVKVVYEGDIPERSFTGGFSRKLPLSSVLKVLEINNVRFRFSDMQLTVLP